MNCIWDMHSRGVQAEGVDLYTMIIITIIIIIIIINEYYYYYYYYL